MRIQSLHWRKQHRLSSTPIISLRCCRHVRRQRLGALVIITAVRLRGVYNGARCRLGRTAMSDQVGRPNQMQRRVVMAIHIDESWRDVIREVAREEDRTISSLVRRALAESDALGDRLTYRHGNDGERTEIAYPLHFQSLTTTRWAPCRPSRSFGTASTTKRQTRCWRPFSLYVHQWRKETWISCAMIFSTLRWETHNE